MLYKRLLPRPSSPTCKSILRIKSLVSPYLALQHQKRRQELFSRLEKRINAARKKIAPRISISGDEHEDPAKKAIAEREDGKK